jgi:hypothetical protein
MTQPKKKPTTPKPPTDPGDAKPAPPSRAYKTVTLKGRAIQVRKPDADQLLVWDRVLQRIETMAAAAETANQIRRLVNKCDIIINALIVNEEDQDWLENQQLAGTLNLREAGSIVLKALEAYGDEVAPEPPNRAARRAKA